MLKTNKHPLRAVSTDREEPTLRYDLGGYEETVLSAIIVVQAVLAVMMLFVGYWFLHLTVGTFDHPGTPITEYFGFLPVIVAMVVAVYLLGKLYE